MNTETINQIKELVMTLNLESQTTLQVIDKIEPILWWKFVYMPFIGLIIAGIGFVLGFYLLTNK